MERTYNLYILDGRHLSYFNFVLISALSDSFRNYFFNGDYVITHPAKHKVAGTVFTYERTGFGQERVFALGPTTVPVHVEVRMSSQVENII